VLELTKHYRHFALLITSYDRFTLYLDAEREINLENGSFDELARFQADAEREVCGFLGYDMKNDLEKLSSANPDPMNFPEAAFFEPLTKLSYDQGLAEWASVSRKSCETAIQRFEQTEYENTFENTFLQPRCGTSAEEYQAAATELKRHLQRGDIYEANYCIHFTTEASGFDPYHGFFSLYQITEAPFSVFARMGDHFILSASPERFLKRSGKKLISQPIKGTARRYDDPVLDEKSKSDLYLDPKERSENVMIVDLVRNDLSRIAERGSVKVEELFGVHSFKTVHHLVSTVVAELKPELDSWDAIRAAFPMGSMTGAPKIRAMELIERYESFKRGAYSGAFGLMEPNGNFDFNVLIRTLLFNSRKSILGFGVGSAITIQADPEKEYSECLLKADALMRSLRNTEYEITGEIQG
jgi:para-aminobenzoate synthetase component 1